VRRSALRSPVRRHGRRRTRRPHFGRKHACMKTATGGEACSCRSSGRRSLSRARVRETSNHGETMAARPTGARPRGPAQEKGQGSTSSPGLGCTRAGVHACARATCPHGRARERERSSDGSHRRPGRWISRRLERLSEANGARALVKAAAPARNFIPAWHEGRHHQQRRGGAEHQAFHLGSMAGATTRGEKQLSSPRWPLDEVQALV
jgi:hypothetical protein